MSSATRPGSPWSVHYATSGGSAVPGVRYSPVSGTLNFPAGALSESFTIPFNDDMILEGDQTVGLVLSDPTDGATLGPYGSAVLTIQDDTRDRSGPTVQAVQLVKNQNGGTTALAITFSKPLNPTTATNLINYGYSVRTAGRDHKFGTKDDVLIPLNSATYDPSTDTVTLSLGRVIHPPTPFQLTINGSTSVPGVGVGVSDLDGESPRRRRQRRGRGRRFSVVLRGETGGYGAGSSTVSAGVKAHEGSAREKRRPCRQRASEGALHRRTQAFVGHAGCREMDSARDARPTPSPRVGCNPWHPGVEPVGYEFLGYSGINAKAFPRGNDLRIGHAGCRIPGRRRCRRRRRTSRRRWC